MEILLHRVSTGNYRRVIPKVGISKSNVSRQFIDQGAQELEVELLTIYQEGLIVGEHRGLCAVGWTPKGTGMVWKW